jgi:hypothetical protein
MGGHVSFHIRLSGGGAPVHGFLKLPHFSPASLGAIEGHESGDHWFLSGYVLEDFAGRFTAQVPAKPASVEVASAAGASNFEYLTHIADALNRKERLNLSPFEHISDSAPVTVLDEVGIGEREIELYEHWIQKHPDSVSYFYGAVDLADNHAHRSSSWKRAFRHVSAQSKEVGPPLILLRTARSPLAPSNTEVALFSWSPVWLSEEPLERFVALVQATVQASEETILSSWLGLEGSAFREREAEVNKALAACIRRVE